jgi:hypothetical protein
MKVFVDTVAWIALFNKRDSLHPAAVQLMNQLQQQQSKLLTTEFVLLEVADAFCNVPTRPLVVQYLDRIRALNSLEIVPVDQVLLEAGWKFYKQRLDKDWSLTDCISFVTMAQYDSSQAFTFDHHFEQAGYVKLL